MFQSEPASSKNGLVSFSPTLGPFCDNANFRLKFQILYFIFARVNCRETTQTRGSDCKSPGGIFSRESFHQNVSVNETEVQNTEICKENFDRVVDFFVSGVGAKGGSQARHRKYPNVTRTLLIFGLGG